MRHLQTFSLFESTQGLTPEQVEFLNKYTTGTWSVNPTTGLVDVKGDFECSIQDLKDLGGVRFGRVSGHFSCSINSLQTLEGAPQAVGGDFDCSDNPLGSLKGAPQEVGGSFFCSNNSLQTLAGTPQTVGEGFYCSENLLRTLEGGPKTVGGDFVCSNNSLQTLAGAPQTVGEGFYCLDNPLQSLEGAPETVGCEFSSSGIDVPEGSWTVPNLVKEYLESSGKKKDLLGTLVTPESIQKAIDKNPEKMAVELKGVLRDLLEIPEYQNLKFPQRLQGEVDLLSDLSGVGL